MLYQTILVLKITWIIKNNHNEKLCYSFRRKSVGIFAVGFFTIWNFRRAEFSPYGVFHHMEFSQCGIFAVRNFRRIEISPYRIYVVWNSRRTIFLPYVIFVAWKFRCTDISPHGFFAVMFQLSGFMVYASLAFFLSAKHSLPAWARQEKWTHFEIKNEIVFIGFSVALLFVIVSYSLCYFPLPPYVMNERGFFPGIWVKILWFLLTGSKFADFLPAQFDPIYEQNNDEFVHSVGW